VLPVVLVTAAQAQITAGNVYGRVKDESGSPLPAATVLLTGDTIGGLSTSAGDAGEFRFLNLDPGTYTITVSRTGFTTVRRELIVNAGVSLDVTLTLRVAGAAERVTVTAETPVVDTKKVGTSTTLAQEELAKTPSPRDLWAVLRTVPGVLVDGVNIGGSSNDQQMVFSGKGAAFEDTMWVLDGVVITNVGGSGGAYYDFDAFDEIAITTGGADLTVQTGGIGVNVVTKRGTNTPHGSARGLFTHDDLQWSNRPAELERDPRLVRADGTVSDKADHIRQIADYGAEAGGPILKDKLWFWASYGRQDIRLVRLNQVQDRTLLTNYSAKLNWQASSRDTLSALYFLSRKQKFGRRTGYPVEEPDSFLFDQAPAYPDGAPHGLYKAEESHVFGPNLFLDVRYAFLGDGAGGRPRGGVDRDGGVDFYHGVAVGSSLAFKSTRAWHNASADGSGFKTALGGNHELRFGFGYRFAPIRSTTAYSGSKIFAIKLDADGGYAQVHRDGVASYQAQYWDVYLGDTYTRNHLTLKVGLRFDRQTAGNRPSSAAANPAFPDLLPELRFDGRSEGIRWSDPSPRIGATYTLGGRRTTVVRASYSRYAGQLSAYDVLFDSLLGYGSYLAYKWVDRNGDGLAQKSEVLIDQGIQYSGFVDPNNPRSAAASPNRIDPRYEANHDREVIVGIDHELMPNFALSAAYSRRRSTEIVSWTPRIGLTSDDYAAGAPVTANGFTTRGFSPDPAKVAAFGSGRILTNRPDYSRTYDGLELSLIKRLSRRWMARATFSYMDWREHLDGPRAVQNPTRTQASGGPSSGPQVDGDQVAPRGGSRGVVFLTARWQLTGTALYQLPHAFEIGGSLFARQGYPTPVVLQLPAGEDGLQTVLATPHITDNRLPDLCNLDLRLAKSVKIRSALRW
jgi:hypothetical protein